MTLTISNSTGYAIPDDFIGLSFETSIISRNPNKVPHGTPFYLFSPANQPLIELFKTLGIKNLRVGGGTVDTSRRRPPEPADIDQLFDFAKEAGVKVIYSFRLLHGDPTNAAILAKYIWDRYRPQLDYFAIGNEPDWPSYHRSDPKIRDYPTYLADWKKFADAIRSAVPDAQFAGPDTGSDYPVTGTKNTDYHGKSWSELFAEAEKDSGLVGLILQHDYVGQSAKYVSISTAVNALLSREWDEVEYPALYNHALTPVAADGLPFRMTECNDYTGGVNGASNAFASALWALDYMHWWAAHGCAGVNFHNNEWLYTDVVYMDAEGNLHLNPKGYGLKAFDVGSHGNVTPMEISNPKHLNLTAYAVRNPQNLFVTVINKEYDRHARTATVTIVPNASWTAPEVMLLSGWPEDKTGASLGYATIGDGGSWNGRWQPMQPQDDGQWVLTVPSATAAIIKFAH